MSLIPRQVLAPWPGNQITDGKGVLDLNWQKWFTRLIQVVNGQWFYPPYDATNFLAQATTWDVEEADVQEFKWYQLGDLAIVQFALVNTAVALDTSLLAIKVPGLRLIGQTPGWQQNGMNLCFVIDPASGNKTGLCYAANALLGVDPLDGVTIGLERLDGIEFHTGGDLTIIGTVIFECQNTLGTS